MGNPLHFVLVLLSGLFIATYISVCYRIRIAFDQLTTSPPTNGSSYDFIVVGSGSSGSVIVRRLAEAGHSVLLVEAGGPSQWLNGVPGTAGFWMDSDYDWKYLTEPTSKAGLAMHEGGRIKWPRGKVLGGSSMLNWMIHVRGHSKDYDEWSQLGNEGWSYKEVLPFFKKSQNFVGDVEDKDKYHGVGGPLGVMPSPYVHPMNDIYQSAFVEMGFPEGDVNGATEDSGFYSRVQVAQVGGWRMGSFRSYVEPILGVHKVTVLPHAQATQILFKDDVGASLKAIGIEVKRFGETLNYYANKETIISAGAIGSPQLMMLSGLGPAEHLKSLNIKVKKDFPYIGQNLQDHIMGSVSFYTEERGLTTSPLGVINPINYLRLFFGGGGPLTDNALGTNGVIRTKVASPNDSRPDIQMHTSPFTFAIDYGLGLASAFSVPQESYNDLIGPYADDYSTAQLLPTLLRPKSRGSLKLKSANPEDHPIITNGYLENPHDVKTMVEALKFSYSVKDTETFKRHGLKPLDPDTKNCGQHEPFSDKYWECYIRHWTFTVYHHCGTVKMGPDSDPTATLTPKLKVRGVGGLRVADASIMPTLVGGNTHAPCTMIGERAADFILQEHPGEAKDKAQSWNKQEL